VSIDLGGSAIPRFGEVDVSLRSGGLVAAANAGLQATIAIFED
jgi:hypothetical protein